MAKALALSLNVNVNGQFSDAYGITNNLIASNVGVSQGDTFSGLDELFHESGSIAASSNTDIDLRAELDPEGAAITLTTVHLIVIRNTSTTAGCILLVGDSTGILANAWTACFGAAAGTMHIGLGDCWIMESVAGLTVDATHKLLRITNESGANTATYQILIAGVHA